jgi:hypothetical protein
MPTFETAPNFVQLTRSNRQDITSASTIRVVLQSPQLGEPGASALESLDSRRGFLMRPVETLLRSPLPRANPDRSGRLKFRACRDAADGFRLEHSAMPAGGRG